MNLTCPSCESIFRIDPGQIGASGRQVRCGSCSHEWNQPQLSDDEAPAPAAAPAEIEPPAPAPQVDPPGDPPCAARRRAAKTSPQPPPRSSSSRIAVGWVFFLAVVGALAAGAYYGKAQIIAAVPAAAELYGLAGMQVEPRVGEGFELRDVKSVRRLIDGQRVVVIEGTIVNKSELQLDVPRLRASVTNAAGEEVDQWVFSPNSEYLPPGGTTQFRTTTRNAPPEGNLGIDFTASK